MSLTLSYQDQTRHNQDVGGTTLRSAGTNWSFLEQSATYTQQSIIRPTLLDQFRFFIGQEFEPTTRVSPQRKLIVLDARADSPLNRRASFNSIRALSCPRSCSTVRASNIN
ncbi:MAG TPA: hypothetical protein VKE51_15715 [Vicinamibacterales bacterium]|nr:hypothetical protein [Vicinamibacterales bacterium]